VTAAVIQIPGVAQPIQRDGGLNLTEQEVRDACGGYRRPADQLKELHRRGFARAFRRNGAGPVILERGHYQAVISGQYGSPAAAPAAADPASRAPLPPNRVGYRAKFGARHKEG
jgi:hypothetical protein